MKSSSMTAVLPVLNGLPFLRRSLPPLMACVGRDLTEVLVVDDGSADGSGDYAASLGARVIQSTGRTGPASARNLGVAHCTTALVFFVDADVVIHPDAIARSKVHLAAPGVVAVFGSYDDRPSDPGFFSRWKNLQHHFVHSRAPGDAGTFWTGCGAVQRQAFNDVGGFDVARFPKPSIEDIDLGYRLRARGGAIKLDPMIRATHLKKWELSELLRVDVFRRALPWARLLISREVAREELNVSRAEKLRAGLAGAFGVAAVGSMTPFVGVTLLPATALLLGFAVLANARLIALYLRRHGLLFAGGGALFLQVYYLYATGAWLVAWAEAQMGRKASGS